MTKLKKTYYFLPALILSIIVMVACISDVLYFTDYTKLLLNFAVMVFTGVRMYKGKVSGALLGIVFFAGWSVLDYIEYMNTPFDILNQRMPVIWISWTVILFYLICAIELILKTKNKQ